MKDAGLPDFTQNGFYMKNYKIVIGIPTINRADLLKENLAGLVETMSDLYRIIIVDNGKQNIHKLIPSEFKDRSFIHNSKTNLGVSDSWNFIMELAFKEGEGEFQADYVYLVNDDIVLGHTISDINEAIKQNPKAPFILGEASFSNFLVSKQGFYDIGPFDSEFFPAYFEDNDFDRRCTVAEKPGAKEQSLLKVAVFRNSCTIKKDRKLNNNFTNNKRYYIKKWGGPPKNEKFTKPFNGKPPKSRRKK